MRYSIQYLKRRRMLEKRNIIRKRFGEAGGGTDTYTTFTGSLIQFTAPKAHAFKSFSFTVDPVQDLHGQSAPYPAGGGKNKLPIKSTAETINGVTFTPKSDGTIVVNGTASGVTTYTIGQYVAAAGTWGFSGCPPTTSGYRQQWKLNNSGTAFETGTEITKTLTESGTLSAEIVVLSGTTMNNVVFKPMIRSTSDGNASFAPYENLCPISGWNSANLYRTAEYDPTASPSLTLNFPSTVYGGNAVWNGDGTWTITPYPEYDSYNGETLVGPWQSSIDKYVAGTTPTIGAQVVDKGGAGTPFIVSSADLFGALQGENNIWSSTGDTTLEAIGEAIELNALQSLNILLGGRYVNNHTADDVSDEEALNIILGGNNT